MCNTHTHTHLLFSSSFTLGSAEDERPSISYTRMIPSSPPSIRPKPEGLKILKQRIKPHAQQLMLKYTKTKSSITSLLLYNISQYAFHYKRLKTFHIYKYSLDMRCIPLCVLGKVSLLVLISSSILCALFTF